MRRWGATTRSWISAIRPATLTASVGPVLVGSALAHADGRLHLPSAAGALLGAALIQIGTNLVNDVADFRRGADGEDRLGPPRAVQQGWLTERAVTRAAFAAFAGALVVGAALVARGGWPVVLIGTASVSAGIAYTAGPWPLGYHGLGDVFVLAFFGVVAVCGTYFVQALTVTPTVVAASVAIGSLATAILVVNNLRDRETDARVGKRTLAVRFGARFARAEYAALLGSAYVISASFGWLAPLLTLPWAAAEVRAIRSADGAALNPHLGRTAGLGLAFCALLAAGVVL
jgi:1,4-dihydroxy-2-naphthoate octaprenyltransferase